MKREVLFVQQVAIQADNFYGEGERFGGWAAEALGSRQRAQVTGLEGIANSSLKVSDVLDYLKKQTAKDKPGIRWRHLSQERKELGTELIAFIRDQLRQKRDAVCQAVTRLTGQEPSEEEKQQAHIALIRELIRQVAAQYELGASHVRR
jgi:hypothetical protein